MVKNRNFIEVSRDAIFNEKNYKRVINAYESIPDNTIPYAAGYILLNNVISVPAVISIVTLKYLFG